MLGKIIGLSKFIFKYNFYKKSLGYFGWTGMGNLGDEVLFDAVKKLLYPVHVYNHLRFENRGKFVQDILENYLFNGMVLGAGTLINSFGQLKNMQRLQEKKIKTFVFGTGVLDPLFHSQFPNWPNCLYDWVDVLNKCEYVAVRGPLSKNILKEYGYNDAIVCGDPALFFAEHSISKKQEIKTIGINVGTTLNSSTLWGGSDGKVFEFIIELCKILLNCDYKIKLFPVYIKDIKINEDIAKQLSGKIKIVRAWNDRSSFMEEIKKTDIFIGEKLHSVILSLCTYTPSVMLSYWPKGEDFMSSIDFMDFSIRTDRLDLEYLLYLIKFIEKDIDNYQKRLFSILQIYRQRLIDNSIKIKALV